jgi:hypothetical protein
MYKEKYIKYKIKYFNLKSQLGGMPPVMRGMPIGTPTPIGTPIVMETDEKKKKTLQIKKQNENEKK